MKDGVTNLGRRRIGSRNSIRYHHYWRGDEHQMPCFILSGGLLGNEMAKILVERGVEKLTFPSEKKPSDFHINTRRVAIFLHLRYLINSNAALNQPIKTQIERRRGGSRISAEIFQSIFFDMNPVY